jgi:hypothetical protein
MAVYHTVTADQFEISDKGITHKPTGYGFDAASGTICCGRLGEKLPGGEEFRRDEVEAMARALWLAYRSA